MARYSLLIVNFIWIIHSTYELHLPLPDDIDGEELAAVVVDVKEDGERLRRSTDGISVPAEKIEITFPFNNGTVDLHLRRRNELSVNVPVYISDARGNIVRQLIQRKDNVFFYQDQQKFAAFYVETTETSSCMFGSFEDRAEEFFLEPKDLNCSGSPDSTSVFKVLKIKHRQFLYDDDMNIERPLFQTTAKNANSSDTKRNVTEYKVEMLLIVDYSIYNYWFTQSKAGSTANKDTEAKYNIRQYYAWVINGMDVRYKNIQTEAYSISVVYGGIYIADTAAKSAFTETHKDSSSPKPKVDADTVLDSITAWLQNTSGLPDHDNAIMFSRYDFTNSGSSSIIGLAWMSQVCKSRSVSIVEDHFDFIMLSTAAHELGHSLGASHDGLGNNGCKDEHYIMSSRASVVETTNPWKFSSCSTKEFIAYIDSLNSGDGNNCMTALSGSFDSTALNKFTSLPGQIFDADAQCKHIHGSGSSFCNTLYDVNYTTICTTLWCFKTDGSGDCIQSVGGDGLQCGNRKWCISGVCTYDVSAPPGDESCLFGDQMRKMCTSAKSHLCYFSFFKTACCKTCSRFYTGRKGCEYGDKLPGCTSACCPQYGKTYCCGHCFSRTTPQTTEITTEEPNLCGILQTTSRRPPTLTTEFPTTANEEIKFTFVLEMAILITENLSDSIQYSSVKGKAESALSTIYSKRLGSHLKTCRVTALRKGSLIVDYGLITKSDASAASSIMSVNQALLSGKENVTYDGRSTPVSSMAFVDSSGGFVNFTSTTTQCQILEANNPCNRGTRCVEEQNGPVCR
ncbi:A disintegrin and metalloproteinase with thrombospondin motifs 3-like [Ostrea edulis]|uniref:A disintegrin and metalloproteinase with thrombospondin motifs 3-like n=1 Tax=Ostrea edulis TaxID=37623 RepID=UPI0024AF1F4E|nr:A disintegrin and metalloproteinase with thrombospondin motifs 3-like [Ostrea edulis]